MSREGDSREAPDRREAERRDTPERRRTPTEQRRYNRRSPVSDVPPPYFETFDRIASALERIEQVLEERLGPAADRPRGVVPPARDSGGT